MKLLLEWLDSLDAESWTGTAGELVEAIDQSDTGRGWGVFSPTAATRVIAPHEKAINAAGWDVAFSRTATARKITFTRRPEGRTDRLQVLLAWLASRPSHGEWSGSPTALGHALANYAGVQQIADPFGRADFVLTDWLPSVAGALQKAGLAVEVSATRPVRVTFTKRKAGTP